MLIAENDGYIIGWAAINQYSTRCAYDGVGDISIYIHRDWRGKGVGSQLLQRLEDVGRENKLCFDCLEKIEDRLKDYLDKNN